MDTNPDRSADPLSPLLEAIGPGLALIGFPTFVVDTQLRYRYVNAAYEQYFGRAAGELVGRSVDEIHGPPPSDGRREALLQALAGESLTFDRQARHGPNAGQWARLHYMPIRAGAAVVGVNIVLVGIQHLKEAQEAIAARERQLALITDTIGFPLTYVDREGIVRFANAQSAAWSGLKPEDMIGRSARELAPPEVAAQSLPLLERALAGEAIVYERAALWPGRESRRIRGHMIPDRDASGIVRGAIIVVLDIEEDHRLKEALLARTRELQLLTENVGVPMAYIGADRRFRFVNTPGLDWLPGLTIENIVGKRVDEVYPPEIVAAVYGNLERALAGKVVAYERQGSTPAGERRWVRVTLIPDKADDGSVRGVYTIVIDIDEDRRLREALETQGRELRFFTDNIPVSVAYLDTQRRYVFVNRAFAQSRGTTREEIIGRTTEEVIGRKAADELAPLVKRVLAGETTTYEREIDLPSGERRWFHVRSVPDFGPDGVIRGMYVVGHDVQELKVAQASLQEKEQELREVIDSIPTPMVYVDAEQCYRYVNDAFLDYVNDRRERILGRKVREVLGPERHDALKPVLERVLAGETVTVTRPIVYFDGRSRWMHIRYTPRRDASGRVLGYYATTSDIHEQKAVEEELRRANSILSAHFESTPLAVIEWDPSLRVIRWSGAAATIFGWSADEMLGRTVANRDFIYEDDVPAVNAMIRRLFDGPSAQSTILNRNYRKDGSVAWVEWHNSALRDASGALVSILSLAQDVSSRIQAEERLQFMATHDGLTGLPNRVLLTDRLTSAISRAQRSGAGMAVLFLDLDHFKDVNDTFGHRIGDELLKSMARRVRGSLRQSDILVRLSGDEFVIVLEGLENEAGPDRVAQKILDDVMRPFAIENHEVQVSGSLGYAVFPADGGDPETLLKNADAAMYHAKELGRSSYRAFSKSLAQRRDRRLEHRAGAEARDPAGRVRALLPADPGRGGGPCLARGGAGALARPRQGPGAAAHLHSRRRGGGAHARPRPLGVRDGRPAGGGLARRRHRQLHREREPLRQPAARFHHRLRARGHPREDRLRALLAHGGDHRDQHGEGRGRREPHAAQAPAPRPAHRDRRLRHRLLEPFAPAPHAGGLAQDRQVVRRRHRARRPRRLRRRRRGDRRRGDGPRARPGAGRRGRGCRAPGPARLPARAGLHRLPGLPGNAALAPFRIRDLAGEAEAGRATVSRAAIRKRHSLRLL